MVKHGKEYNKITNLDVDDDVDVDAFNTLMSDDKPRVVFDEGSLNAGDKVLFKAHTTFLPYDKNPTPIGRDGRIGRDEATFHRWIPGYGAAHTSWKTVQQLQHSKNKDKYTYGTKRWDDMFGKKHLINHKNWVPEKYTVTAQSEDVHLEEGELTTKEQDTVDRLEEKISAWAVFSAEKKIDRNVTFETLSGGPGEDYIKFKVDTGESTHGDSSDTVFIMAFGQ